MKYNSKYDRWVTKGGLVYRYDKKKDRLVQCKLSVNSYGYHVVRVQKPKNSQLRVSRLVWETFNGEIADCMVIDHINTIKDDNRLENLRCVTQADNNRNPLTRKHRSEAKKGFTKSEFGIKFKEHFGITNYENPKLYSREHAWYRNHNKVCRWEVEDK